MAGFKGQASYSIDAKGRVAIPAKMRNAMNPEAKGTFTVTRGFEKCIFLYPLDRWTEMEQEIGHARGVLLAFDVAFLFEHFEEFEDAVARPDAERLADVLERRRLAVIAHVRADEFVGLVLPLGQACFHGGIKQEYM